MALMPPTTFRVAIGDWCRRTRIDLDISQQELADAVGISRTYLAAIEAGRANPTTGLVERMGDAMDTRFELIAHGPILMSRRAEADVVHARCSAYGSRRFGTIGLELGREVGVLDGRTRGWIDLLAFDRRTGTMFIVEIKTDLDDVGRTERQIDWYERVAMTTDLAKRWRPRIIRTWLLLLATSAVEDAVARHRDLLATALPARAGAMRRCLTGEAADDVPHRGLALIDPRRRGREWLLPTRVDGRRSPAPYADREAARRALLAGRPARCRCQSTLA
jgi:transcriptional regulator with XRE-family HTH domain